MTTATAEYLSPTEAAALLACSPKTVHRAIARGDLSAVRYGRSLTRIARTELDRFVAAHSTTGRAPRRRRTRTSA